MTAAAIEQAVARVMEEAGPVTVEQADGALLLVGWPIPDVEVTSELIA